MISEAKEKANEIVSKFISSHMASYKNVAITQEVIVNAAKESALLFAHEMFEQWGILETGLPTEFVKRQMDYWYKVKHEIKEL
jgi:hypothetical protein